MPDVTEMLMSDHREVEELFDRYEASRDAATAEEICTELTVHAAVEEKVVYPVLSEDVEDGAGMREHGEHEHQEVKDLIFEVQRAGTGDPRTAELMKKMKRAVLEHVSDEEGDVFPRMRQDLGDDRLDRLGEEAAQVKQQLLAEAEEGGPLMDLTKEKLYQLAQEKGIEGRSDMTKEELISALRAQWPGGPPWSAPAG